MENPRVYSPGVVPHTIELVRKEGENLFLKNPVLSALLALGLLDHVVIGNRYADAVQIYLCQFKVVAVHHNVTPDNRAYPA